MSKKMMFLALAVACAAMFGLSAAASAQTAHISATTSFTVSGVGGTLTSHSGSSVVCTGTSGFGSFFTTTAGLASLVFSGCKSSGFNCTNTGNAGQIEVTNEFDGIMVSAGVSTGKAGILLTPTGESHLTSTGENASKTLFTEFTCLGFISIKVYGNGVIGTLGQACNAETSTYSLVFESSETKGTQRDLAWTGIKYDLINSQASHPTSSLDGSATLTLAGARKLLCT